VNPSGFAKAIAASLSSNAKTTTEQRSASAVNRQAAKTLEERRKAARKGWQTRRRNQGIDGR
jgi:hypothetical protein